MKNGTLYMIGNAHIDPVWLWQWPDGFQEIKATFRSALDRMKEFDDFIFTSSSASYYEWIERNDPDLLEEIKERVKEGRWVICNGWWVQPDCNIPTGESFARHGLYGQRFFREKLGTMAKTGYNVDSFGHSASLPQILKKSGMDAYVFMRPGPHEMGLPAPAFLWESPDGSQVKAFRIPYEYCTWPKEISGHVKRCALEIKQDMDSAMCFYGVGNHGGGPTKENIRSILEMDKDQDLPRLRLSSPDQFFAALEGKTLPVVCSDLLHHASGCYSVNSPVKMLNRRAENRLMMAEKLGVLSSVLTKHPYRKEELTTAWKKVLFNQFHDILDGCCLEEAYDDARDSYGQALNLGLECLHDSVSAISWRINIDFEEHMYPIVVFNPCGFSLTSLVTIESRSIPADYALFDHKQQEIPFQRLRSSATSGGRSKLAFMAELPALGYQLYCLRKLAPINQEQDTEESGTIQKSFEPIFNDGKVLEGTYLRLEIDENGYLKSLFKKDTNMELLVGPGAVPVVIEDKSDTWSHGIRRFNKVLGQFKADRIIPLETGPVKSTIRVMSSYESSKMIQDFSVYQDMPYVDVQVEIDWREQFKMLKLQFPLNLHFRKAIAETPYGYTERASDGDEYPMQTWVDVSGEVRGRAQELVGLAFINDGKTAYDINNQVVSLSLLRSPIFAYHDPLVPDPEAHYSFIDNGKQRFTYRLHLHDGSFEKAGIFQSSQSLNQAPYAVFETFHSGNLPAADSFISIKELESDFYDKSIAKDPNADSSQSTSVLLTAVKMAEDGAGFILRFYEAAGIRSKVSVNLAKLGRTLTLNFAPSEIKTLFVPFDGEKSVEETNLLEDVIQ